MQKSVGLYIFCLVGIARAASAALCPEGGASHSDVAPIMSVDIDSAHSLALCGNIEESVGVKTLGSGSKYVSEFDVWALGYPQSPFSVLSRGAGALFEFAIGPTGKIFLANETVNSPVFDKRKRSWIDRRVPFVLFEFKCDSSQCNPPKESCAFKVPDDSKLKEAVGTLMRRPNSQISMKQLTNLEEHDRIVTRIIIEALAGSNEALRLIQQIEIRKDLDGMVGQEIDDGKYLLERAKKVGCLK